MKFFKLSALVLTAAIAFAGCTKSERQVRKPSKNIDSSVWINNLIDGKAAAAKENKKIFLFFSADDQDTKSLEFKNTVFNKPEFIEKMTQAYVLVNIDFSASLFEAAQAEPTASEEEKKEAGRVMAILEENMRDAGLYNIEGSPAFYVLTKEGYAITELIFSEGLNSIDDFEKVMIAKNDEIAAYENILSSTETGKKEDRLAAINRLFEVTEPQLRYLLSDKAADYINLDKKNETGAVGGYVVALANARAVQCYLDQDAAGASEEFAKTAENKYLTPEQKQQCYYTAGYLYAQSGKDDYETIKDYLQKAYDANPESENAQTIQSQIRMMDERYQEDIVRQAYENSEKDNSDAAEASASEAAAQ